MAVRSADVTGGTLARLRSRILPGASKGFFLWLGYGVLEAVLVNLTPALSPVARDPVPLSGELTLVLPFAYAVVGALLTGGLQALLGLPGSSGSSSGVARRTLSVLAVLTLVVACAANLLSHPASAGTPEEYGVCAFLLAVSAASILSESAASRLRFATRPLCVLLLLLVVPSVASIAPAGAIHRRLAVAGAALCAVLALSAVVSWSTVALRGHRRVWRRGPVVVLAAIAVLGVVVTSLGRPAAVRDDAQPPAAPHAALPNVVLVVMDTVRADHLSLYGYPRRTSPNLERLAEQATVYTNAISAGSMTLSTHASIFTGLYPRRHGAHYDLPHHPGGRRLPNRFETLAEILSRHGYATLGVAANYGYLGSGFGLDRGFAYYDSRSATPLLRGTMPFYLRQGATDLLGRMLPPCDRDRTTRRAEDIDAEAFRLIDGHAGRPFFLFLNYMDAHTPYCPPPPYDTLFPGRLPRFTNAEYLRLEKAVLSGRRQVTRAVRDHLISQYDGGIAYLDHELGRLVAHLEARGLLGKTLLIVTSDHGEAFGERGLIEHGVSVYQDQVHVPLLIRFPGEARGAVVRDFVSSVDLMPTALDVAGIREPAGLPGRSLLDPDDLRGRAVYTESYPNGYLVTYSARFNRVARAVLSGSLKLIVTTAGRSALFDLSDDAHESHDLLQDGEVAPLLRAKLVRWLRATKPAPDPASLDPAAMQRLRALGYVE